MTAAGTVKVWDLNDSSAHRRRPGRRSLDLAAPIAAVLGVIALVAALWHGMPTVNRWCVVVPFGGIGLLVGFSALRRRQTAMSMLLALAGIVLPIAAGVIAATASDAPPAVTNSSIADTALADVPTVLTPSPTFGALPADERTQDEALVDALVLRLRSLHTRYGPFPTQLAQSNGQIVESAGLLRGTPLGVLPIHSVLRYEVARSGETFRVTVVSTTDPTATVSGTSELMVADS